MNRINAFLISLTKTALEYPFLWAGVLYLLWFVKLPVPIDENFEIGVWLLGVYVIIATLEKLLGGNKLLSIVLLIFILPVTFIAGWLFLNLVIETFGWLGSEVFYIPFILLFSGYAAVNLCQRSSNDNKTLRTLLFIVILPILSINIAYPISYFPDVTNQKDLENDRYYLVWEIDTIDVDSRFTFYKCQKLSINCEELYRTYAQMFVDEILIDKEKKEVSIIDSDHELGLAFTYGENPRMYDGYAVELGDHTYQLSIEYEYGNCRTTDCDIEAYIYTLYECDLDYTSCDMLPVKYTMTSVWGMYLDVNESTNEINAYDLDDTLIFTYRERPVCYVDGCAILDQ